MLTRWPNVHFFFGGGFSIIKKDVAVYGQHRFGGHGRSHEAKELDEWKRKGLVVVHFVCISWRDLTSPPRSWVINRLSMGLST